VAKELLVLKDSVAAATNLENFLQVKAEPNLLPYFWACSVIWD